MVHEKKDIGSDQWKNNTETQKSTTEEKEKKTYANMRQRTKTFKTSQSRTIRPLTPIKTLNDRPKQFGEKHHPDNGLKPPLVSPAPAVGPRTDHQLTSGRGRSTFASLPFSLRPSLLSALLDASSLWGVRLSNGRSVTCVFCEF